MRESAKRLLAHPRTPWLLAAVAVLLASPALLFSGYKVDDWLQHFILEGDSTFLFHNPSPWSMFEFADGSADQVLPAMEMGFLPWWTLPTVLLSFWRPVSVATHLFDHALWPDSTFMMHVHGLAWLAAMVFVAALFYRDVLGKVWVAGLAALLFAVEDAHAMPAGWIANRNGLITVFFGLLALRAHMAWRRGGGARYAGLALLCLALSLLAKEAGISVCAYLFGYAVFVDEGPWRKRLATLVPYGVVVVVWRVVYMLLGHGIWGAQAYNDPFGAPAAFWGEVLRCAPALFLGQWAGPPSDIHLGLPINVQWAVSGIGMAFILLWFMAFLPTLKRRAEARFLATGMMLSLLPACASFPNDRLLVFAGIGAFGLLALFVSEGLPSHASKPARFYSRAWLVGLVVLHLVLAPLLLPLRVAVFGLAATEMTRCVAEAPIGNDPENTTLVIAYAPNIFYSSYLPLVLEGYGRPRPKCIRSLSPNTPLGVPVDVTRIDAHSLEYTPEGGYPWYLVRNNRHPMPAGQRVELPGMSVEVMTLTDRGWPGTVRYRFDKPLEDPSLYWIRFEKDGNHYVPYTPPAIGETEHIDEPLL